MVYLVIKELSTIAEDVIMVTSSIMKDMQPNLEVIYRPNAIRALARIIDVSLYLTTLRTHLTRHSGAVGPVGRAFLQVCLGRPLVLHLVGLAHLFVSSLYLVARHHQTLVQ